MSEGEVKPVPISSMKKGSYIVIDGVACVVQDTQTSRPGKHGHAKVRLTATGILENTKKVIVMPGHDNIETPIIGKKTAQILSITGDSANVMDMETYETFDLKIPDELKGDVVEGSQVLYWIILKDKVMKQIKGGD